MSLEQYAQLSNYAIAAGTVVVALAFLAHLAEWGFALRSEPAKELVAADGSVPVEGATTGSAGVVDDEDPDRSTVFSSVGVSVAWLATLVLLVGVVTRGLAAQRVPWGNMYEFACTGTLIALAVYLVLVRVWDIEWLGVVVTGFSLVLLGIGFSVYVPAGPLVPALHSYWLVIHVAAVMTAGALFLLSAGASALYLVVDRAERRGTVGKVLGRLPTSANMDRLAFRLVAVGFPLWTFGALIAGPIWAYYAWARFWGWDPKEVWALITWIAYAVYLHARVTAGWKGRRAAVIGLIGFATFLFSFYGVNLIFGGSMHTYAK
ncbi:c-type cytochrome biogenesis protein CcsB [Aeromicrobium sp. Root495]|uniref:c-type cytochrome biogenesis protein CcsB n=1 Tax=Aeromicrobium sp. Root495 TaxID=1736550 RepID=UPI0006F934C8|nr:c-type cytochrome biogenesis protein CcsB [Aeromicrobium sp. Root495]KQY60390.1 c-type cytochrome biogenesis protein CcsB [Aeromicrobium sp. Root495]